MEDEEYPIGVLVLTKHFEVGDRICPYESAQRGYVNLFSATNIDVESKSGKDKQFVKLLLDNPQIIADIDGPKPLKSLATCSLFKYEGRRYRKTSRTWTSVHCPKYMGVQSPVNTTATVIAIVAENTDGSYTDITEFSLWMNEETIVEIIKQP